MVPLAIHKAHAERYTCAGQMLSILLACAVLAACGGSSSGGGGASSSESSSSQSSTSVSSSSSSDSSSSESSSSQSSSSSSSSSPGNTDLQKSQKRGLAYGHHSPDDLAAMQGTVAWWYNWYIMPELAVRDNYTEYDFEFVPMAWDGSFDETNLRSFLDAHPDVKYLLGFNEPNFASQANMTPAQAAAAWPALEAIAADYDLKLVAPAVNYSPGDVDIPGTDDNWSPWEYLDAFFEACEGCQVDYISVHSYMKYAGAFEWFIGEFERYELPIWVTEWASWDEGGPANVGEQMDYLADTVRWMEANPNVYRYSWFIGRSDGGPEAFPYIDILAGNGELSPLGGLYTAIPSEAYRYHIPARIQAQGAHRQSDFRHQATEDASGYVNLVPVNTSAWAEYDIVVAEGGEYQFDFRIASAQSDQSLTVLLNDEPLLTQDLIHTGGAQVWQTFTTQAGLSAGEHRLRIEAVTAGFGFNWFEISAP